MKIAVITPHYHPAVRGNAVTVRRIERNLIAGGCEVRVFSLDAMCAEEIVAGIKGFSPDVVHAFHAYYGGRIARLAARHGNIPYVITLTGTDVHEMAADHRRQELLSVLAEARALVAFDESMRVKLSAGCPDLADKTVIIPQGVEVPPKPEAGRGSPGKRQKVFFLPAGVRPVKNVLFPLAPLAELHREEPEVQFILAGPVIDSAYAATVLERFDHYPFAHYLGEISHGAIRTHYEEADVVLNTSLFEGGMANSILEALALGRPVLAAAIDGNRSVVRDGETGFLYGSEADFIDKARLLLRDKALGERLGAAGRQFALTACSPEKEGTEYRALYRQVLSLPLQALHSAAEGLVAATRSGKGGK